jgi:hypothetical protein
VFRLALFGGLALAAAVFVLSAVPAVGASSGSVSASVTPSAACLTVTPSSLDFGTANFSRVNPGGNVESVVGGNPLTVTNCSQDTETIFVSATAATNAAQTASWSLNSSFDQCAAGPDQYAINLSNSAGFLTTAETTFRDFVGGGNTITGTTPFLHMPCSGSHGAGEAMSFSINFTATIRP